MDKPLMIHDVLLDFFDQKKSGDFSINQTESKLKQLGITEKEIHAILIEFDFEWNKEQIGEVKVKQARQNKKLGYILAFSMAALSITSAVTSIFGGITILFYGAVATGILLVFKSNETIKLEKLRKIRRVEKWKLF